MSKEDILNEWLRQTDHANIKDGHRVVILSAMEEYATQQVKKNVVLDNVSNSEVAKQTAKSIWKDLRVSEMIPTEKNGSCFRPDSVVRAINRFIK